MAVEKGNNIAMNRLGVYYKKQEDYDNMIKYYQMAIEKGNSNAMYNLGLYYEKQEDYDNMMKYYQMATEKGDLDAMNNLGFYYEKKKDYDNMAKIAKMIYDKTNNDAMIDEFIDFILVEISNRIDLLELFREYLDKSNIEILNCFLSINQHLMNKEIYKEEECCVCYEKKRQLILHCKHNICPECYNFIDKCPICRDAF
jgi:tetratricopeptide (TPR) repeat protein